MMKRFFKSGSALLTVVILAALAALAGCPGAGPDTSRALASIAITSEPARTMYAKGEALDLAGLEVTATYSDGATAPVEVTADHISFDSEAVGEVAVAVTVADKKAFFTITVTDPVSEALAFGEAHAAVLILSPSSITAETAAEYEADVDAALTAYQNLSEGARALAADQKTTLDALKSGIDELLAPGRAEAFRAAHEAVLALTADTVTADHEAAVDAALAAYNELSEAARALTAAEKTLLDSLKQRAGGLKERAGFRTVHAVVLALTAETVSTDDEAAVDAALAAYTELSEGAQALAAAEKALLDNLKVTIADLQNAENASEADRTAAAVFVSTHEAILGKTADTVAVDDEAAVDAALTAYNALGAQVKALVGARKALLDSLKTKIADIKTAAAFRTEHAAVLNKDPSTAAIADESTVDAVVAAYDVLSAGAKTLLAAEKAALDTLKQAIGALREAAADRVAAEEFKTDHAAVLAKTAANVAVGDEAMVDAALAAYNFLGAQVRALLAEQKTLLDSLKGKIDETTAPAAAAGFATAHAAILLKTPGTVTVADEADVNAALLAWNSLNAIARGLVATEKALLDSLRQAITALREAAADQNAADLFKANHAAILSKNTATVVISDEAAADEALAAHDALRPGAKILTAAEKSLLDQLKAKIVERIAQEGIFNVADFAKIGVDPAYPANGSYTLMADITLSNWTPLCPDEAHAFSGTFDGNRHTITITGFNNAYVQANSYIGIFGYVKGASPSAKALIRNVKVVSSVAASSEHDGGQTIGLMAGYANMAVIENIVLQGSLNFSSLIGVVYVGGVAGWIEYETAVRNCDSSMFVGVSGGYDVPLDPNIVVYNATGGFVGLFKNNSEIRDCHNTGNVSGGAAKPSDALVASRGGTTNLPDDFQGGGGTSNDPGHAQAYTGGIVGSSSFAFVVDASGGIYNCSSRGNIEAGAGGWWAIAAGISGSFFGARMEYCVAGGTIKAESQYAYAGGMTGYGDANAVFYRCSFVGIIAPYAYYKYGPITGQYGKIVECDWSAASAPEPAPQAGIDFSGKLTGLGALDTKYTVNGVEKQADASGCIPIEDPWFGSTVLIIKKKVSQIATGDSAPQSLAIPQRPVAPTGLSAGPNFISGVKTSMEWAPLGAASWNSAVWTACSGTSITGLAPGIYYVRYKQTGAVFPGANAALAVSLTIMSAAELAKIGVESAYPINGAYKLGADITLSNWKPLKFAGSFNGNGHRITIESFNSLLEPTYDVVGDQHFSIGIFGTIVGPSYETPAVIENLNISISNGAYAAIDGLITITGVGGANIGTIAGDVCYVLLQNIHVDGAAIAFSVNDGASNGANVGGIVGYADSSVIKECGNSAAITVGASLVGGIAGTIYGRYYAPITTTIVEACYATGAITTNSADSVRAEVGGIAGLVRFSTIKRSHFAGSITVDRGNDWTRAASDVDTKTGVGGIAGLVEGALSGNTIEDCHSSGVFTATSTNTGGNNNGMALGGILGYVALADGEIIQRCYSTAALNIQRDTKTYAGGIVAHLEGGKSPIRIVACVALNTNINVEYSQGGSFALHRIVGKDMGAGMLPTVRSRNIAWGSMPLSTTQTGQPAKPFTEAPADRVRSGLAGEDCAQKPTQSEYTALNWDFSTVWQMGSNGYPELR
jgi:hypothetical protein